MILRVRGDEIVNFNYRKHRYPPQLPSSSVGKSQKCHCIREHNCVRNSLMSLQSTSTAGERVGPVLRRRETYFWKWHVNIESCFLGLKVEVVILISYVKRSLNIGVTSSWVKFKLRIWSEATFVRQNLYQTKFEAITPWKQISKSIRGSIFYPLPPALVSDWKDEIEPLGECEGKGTVEVKPGSG